MDFSAGIKETILAREIKNGFSMGIKEWILAQDQRMDFIAGSKNRFYRGIKEWILSWDQRMDFIAENKEWILARESKNRFYHVRTKTWMQTLEKEEFVVILNIKIIP